MLLASLSYELHEPTRRSAAGDSTVLLLGSLGSDRSMWSEQVRALAQSFRVLAVDLRGHGGSEIIDGPSTVEELALDIVSVIDSLEIDKVHMVGLSLGGAVALEMGIRHSERLESLALICTAAKFGEAQPWLDRAALVRKDGMQAVAGSVASRWVSPGKAEASPELMARLERMVLATPAEGYASACEALASYDVRRELGSIKAPVLGIAGSDDPATPPERLQEILDGIGHGQLVVLDPAAHVPTFEQSERRSDILQQHVLDNVGGSRW